MAYKLDLEKNPLFDNQQPKKKKRGRPKKDDIVRGNSVQEGLTEEYTRATFIIKVDLVEKLKDYAYTERLTLKEATNDLLNKALEKEEKRISEEGRSILKRKGGN